MDMKKVIKELHDARRYLEDKEWSDKGASSHIDAINNTLTILKEQEKKIKALCLLIEWAEECNFGFDQFPNEYEQYKDEIKYMKHIDGMIHVTKRTLEDHGAF